MNKKFPRIPHLPFSPGATRDDKKLKDFKHLLKKNLVITEKMDGSNLAMTCDEIFSRSHNGPPTHESFDYAKGLWSMLRHKIPKGDTIFGEYLYAKHSIGYDHLPGYFMVFAIRNDNSGITWSWEDTKEVAKILNLPTVPELGTIVADWYEQNEDEPFKEMIECMATNEYLPQEGVVVRVADMIKPEDWYGSIAKWVRKDHVQTDEHWTNQLIVVNKLGNIK